MTTNARRPRRTPRHSASAIKWTDPETNVWKLAEEQGVSPVLSIDQLAGTFWPKTESADSFLAAMKEWDREAALSATS